MRTWSVMSLSTLHATEGCSQLGSCTIAPTAGACVIVSITTATDSDYLTCRSRLCFVVLLAKSKPRQRAGRGAPDEVQEEAAPGEVGGQRGSYIAAV